ncbi:hypothetical protein PF005_g495 [Phytophthora fragariae]|uniref:Uncharacterized protein n=2 Tax=Phytophthora TaxID=4783 RepID=A0A6A3MAD6_9STRA|nr:hypothetical protein PF003_g9979 [Phytophthora fragariae]KAE9047832.1 hypothetical protein PR002_g792 [Phytophthora rubi]KAE8949941.1 hypothetical protein PF009_g500 [Phytophthora fragariae]KAE9029089.1 hypothetical protein PF011_g1238 [Phytophthora fragariae]KAE9052553.1 hypothetical protein PR001_g378 [Phytophthora rubi]
MASVTWRSSWSVSDAAADVSVQQLPDARGGVAALSALPLRLTRPKAEADAACELALQWPAQPLRCLQLQLQVQCSARHLELHAEGTRRNMIGQEEQGETYLGTFRGTKQSAHGEEPQLFTMSPAFKQSDRDCNVLKSLRTLRVKFVSLTGDKNALELQRFQCVFVPMQPVAAVGASEERLAAKMAGLGVGAAPDVQMLLKGFQQTMEREMETKIARVVDAKLATLSQRLAFSEQALFQLHKKMDAKDATVQASLVQIQHQFSQLEDQLSHLSAAKVVGVEEKNNEEVESEKTNNTDPDDVKRDEVAEAEADVAVAESE